MNVFLLHFNYHTKLKLQLSNNNKIQLNKVVILLCFREAQEWKLTSRMETC